MYLLSNIKCLFQTDLSSSYLRGNQMQQAFEIEDAYLILKDGKIYDYGKMTDLPELQYEKTLDCKDRYVLPTWCDSHTHSVFAASREHEFKMRLEGKTYQEIAQAGGGILNSALKMQDIEFDVLYENTMKRIDQMIQLGTGALEIKSGYGLTVENELKMLRVIKKIKENVAIPIKSTFLGAHAFPAIYKENNDLYIQEIIDKMLPTIADEGLADYCDAFVEQGFFSVEEADRIFEKAVGLDLKIKIHANQMSNIGAVQLGMKYQAKSLDHLEHLSDRDFKDFKNSETVATLLPSAAFFLNDPMPPARTLLKENAIVSLATDFNPGTSPSYNFPFMMSLACIKLRMLPQEVLHASTINAAYAMDIEKTHGSILRGKAANIILTEKMPSIDYLFYSFGENNIYKTIINGCL